MSSQLVRALFDTRLLLVAFAAAFVAGTVGRALTKPLWHDEIFTLYIATRTSMGGLWNALASGVDLNPPLYYLAVRPIAWLVGAGAFATRAPALIGFTVATIAVYAFVRERVHEPAAAIAAMTPSLTGASIYAYEGRPYGLVLGCSAVALVAWQVRDRDRTRWLAPLVCCAAIATGILAHYYAVLIVIPLVAGELVRTLRRRTIDWMMWAAIVVAPAAIVLVLPLVAAARQFAPTFWSPPAPKDLLDVYRLLLEPLAAPAFAAALIASAWLLMPARFRRTEDATRPISRPGQTMQQVSPEEIAVAIALVLLPVAGFALALGVTGAFHERYVLQAVLGVAILAGWWSASLIRTRRDAAIVLVSFLLVFAARQAGGAVRLVRAGPDPIGPQRQALSVLDPGDPLVVSHALAFLPMAHYSARPGAARVAYLTRPPDVVRRLGNDTSGRALSLLARIAPIDVEDYDAFVRQHARFYVYGPRSWLVPELLSQHASLRLVRESGDDTLYLVDMNGDKEQHVP